MHRKAYFCTTKIKNRVFDKKFSKESFLSVIHSIGHHFAQLSDQSIGRSQFQQIHQPHYQTFLSFIPYIFLALSIIPHLSFASSSLLEGQPLPVPHFGVPEDFNTHLTPPSTQLLSTARPLLPKPEEVKRLAQELETQFQEALAPLELPPPVCSSQEASSYVQALFVKGQFDDCMFYAKSCAQQVSQMEPLFFASAAQCASIRFDFSQAKEFYELATHSKLKNKSNFDHAVYNFASFAMYGIYENEVDSILNLNPLWSTEDKKFYKSLIKRLAQIEDIENKKEDIDRFLVSKIESTSGPLRSQLVAVRIEILGNEFKYAKALDLLKLEAKNFRNPFLWYDLAYRYLYSGLDKRFAEARLIYDVFDKYSHPCMRFNRENNTYNYTQLYNQICRDQLLQGREFQNFQNLKSSIRQGQHNLQAAIKQLYQWNQAHPNKADILTTLASLQSINNQREEAFQNYWQAHKLCRYYNRANWGLTLEKRNIKYTKLPEYNANNERVLRELNKTQKPESIKHYISNWNSLSEGFQERVLYGSRIWFPYLESLKIKGWTAYIKMASDLLSESPGMKELRDQRIGGANYPNDNRLWDDVRGAGGRSVVADAAEVFNTVHGDYNLLGHEIAHQFQFFMEKTYRPGLDCIVSLYEQAEIQNNFPDAYSALNKEEHFAQGVTYYLIPSDSPKRFGLNQNWLVRNNPYQLSFIQTIESSGGEMSMIQCN